MSWDWGSAITGAIQGFMAGNIWGAVAGFVAGGLAGGDAKRSARNKQRDALNANLQDRTVMVQSALADATHLYGLAMTSGPIAFAHEAGANKEILWLIVCLAPHQCDSVQTHYLENVALTLDGSGYVTNSEYTIEHVTSAFETFNLTGGAVTATLPNLPKQVLEAYVDALNDWDPPSTVPFTWTAGSNVVTFATSPGLVRIVYDYISSVDKLVRIKPHDGASSQAADADVIAECGSKWTSAHQLKGICYTAIRLQFHMDIFGNIGLPNYKALVKGKKILDPRTGLTVWTDNWALVAKDYLSSALGVTTARLPDADVIVEANACDELVTIDAVGTAEKRYTFNGSLASSNSPRANLDTLEQAAAGIITQAGGRIYLRAGRDLTPEFTIDESWLAPGPISIQTEPAKDDIYNKVIPSYVSPEKQYTIIEGAPIDNAGYLADDGGETLPLQLDLAGVVGQMRAQRLGWISLTRRRNALQVVLTCNLFAYDTTPGCTVLLTLAEYGWAAKKFEVLARRYSIANGTLELRLRETAAAVWAWTYTSGNERDLTPNTNLANPLAAPAPLTITTIDSGTALLRTLADGTVIAQARINWTASADRWVSEGGKIEVRWARIDVMEWTDAPAVAGDATSTIVAPLQDGFRYAFAVRPRTVQGRAGAWAVAVATALGKTAPPSDPIGVSVTITAGRLVVTWSLPTDLDLAATELRLGQSWATATNLSGGNPTSAPTLATAPATSYDWPWPSAGTYDLLIKHVDTSGNVSAGVAQYRLTVYTDGFVDGAPLTWESSDGTPLAWVNSDASALGWVRAGYMLVDTADIRAGSIDSVALGAKAVKSFAIDDAQIANLHLQNNAVDTNNLIDEAATIVVASTINTDNWTSSGATHLVNNALVTNSDTVAHTVLLTAGISWTWPSGSIANGNIISSGIIVPSDGELLDVSLSYIPGGFICQYSHEISAGEPRQYDSRMSREYVLQPGQTRNFWLAARESFYDGILTYRNAHIRAELIFK